MHVLADLRATADGRPGVDQRTAVHEGADVDIAGHQHDVPGDIRPPPGDRIRHDTKSSFLEILLCSAGELQRYLVEIVRVAAFDATALLDAEVQQHGFLEPLIDHPLAVDLLGDANLPGIQPADGRQHGIPEFRRRIPQIERAPLVECRLDGAFQTIHAG